MGGNLITSGRAQLAGYAGLAGAFRGRVRPAAIVVAVDALAVALAFGALHIAGSMLASRVPPLFAPVVSSLAHPISHAPQEVAPIVDAVRIIPASSPATVLASADADILFAKPMIVDGGFADPVAAFVAPKSASDEGASALSDASVVPGDQTPPVVNAPPVEKVASIAMRGREIADAAVANVANVFDGSLDRLLLRGGASAEVTVAQIASLDFGDSAAVPRPTAEVSASGNAAVPSVGEVTGAVGGVAAPIAAAVTQPVTQIVGNVAGLLN